MVSLREGLTSMSNSTRCLSGDTPITVLYDLSRACVFRVCCWFHVSITLSSITFLVDLFVFTSLLWLCLIFICKKPCWSSFDRMAIQIIFCGNDMFVEIEHNSYINISVQKTLWIVSTQTKLLTFLKIIMRF